jgi:CheY-like chemotaxis protein
VISKGDAKVLLVEDEALVRMVTADALEELGFEVEEAGSAAEALQKIEDEAGFALAIIDIGLPDRRGDLLASDLRQRHAKLPIVLASGYDHEDLAAELDKDPLVSHLAKPYNRKDLQRLFRSLGLEPG